MDALDLWREADDQEFAGRGHMLVGGTVRWLGGFGFIEKIQG